jgi:hypothetical protein
MPEPPPNIKEFNTIAGLIFEQLYRNFPVVVDIDQAGIAKAMGAATSDWSSHKLPSGRSVAEMLAYTNSWLAAEGYTRYAGSHPAERVTLSTTGLTAMNAIPSGLKQTIGTTLGAAAEGSNYAKIGDLIGGIFGGYTKSVAGG